MFDHKLLFTFFFLLVLEECCVILSLITCYVKLDIMIMKYRDTLDDFKMNNCECRSEE